MKKLFLITLSILGTVILCFAENKEIKFGKITKNEVEKSVYKIDTTASAIFLADIGENRITFESGYGFKMNKTIFIRIKILTEAGLNLASNSLSYYRDGENFSKLKAFTYNIENGKLIKSKLTKEGIFKENAVNGDIKKITFTLPNVKVGSVIEYTYEINSKYISSVDTWSFQGSYPRLYSSFTVEFPEFWKFKQLMSGYIPIKTEKEEVNRTPNTNFTYSSTITKYIAENVKAFPKDSYIDSKVNYISLIRHELSGVYVPGQIYENYSTDWAKIRENLSKNEKFGGKIDKVNFIVEELPDSVVNAKNDIHKLKHVYEFINNNLKWNNQNSMYCGESIRTIWKEKTGSAGRINFTLISLLKTLNFEVYPVILKTRSSGLPHPAQIILKDYNYVIALVKLEGKDILLDATDPLLKMGTLPERCINGTGQLISKEFGQEIDLEQNNTYKISVTCNFSFDKNLKLTGNASFDYDDIAGFELRSTYEDENEEDFQEKFTKKIDGFDVEEFVFQNRKNIYSPLKINLSLVKIEETSNTEKIFIDPLLFTKTKENPFKLKEREFPVNYENLINKRIYFKYKVPNGYKVEEMPKPLMVQIPSKGLTYKYQINNLNGELILFIDFKINKRKFGVEEYPMLKEAYRVIVEKESQQIILKKSKES